MDLMHPSDQLAFVMSRLYKAGHTTMSGGNLSIRERSGDLWVTPSGLDKGTLRSRDIVRIAVDGTVSGGKPTSELPFHRAIYSSCRGINAILHAHPPALSVFSMTGQLPAIDAIPDVRLTCGSIGFAPYARMASEDLGLRMAEEFRKGAAIVLMANHGVCVGAEDISTAYRLFETLELFARVELMARRIGPIARLSPADIDLARKANHTRLSEFIPVRRTSEELAARRDLCGIINRALERGLFSIGKGTVSARLEDGSFLITPIPFDRSLASPKDLVLIRRGMKERGKTPSRAAFLHELIYRRNTEATAIISCQPPCLTAFSICRKKVATEAMPESYVLLHEMPLIPFGLNYRAPQQLAEVFTDRNPAAMLENDGVIVTGRSLAEVYDRLEVAELAAQVQLETQNQSAGLNDRQRSDLDQFFPAAGK